VSATIFDTCDFIKRLTAAGMPEAQAEALAEGQVRLIDHCVAVILADVRPGEDRCSAIARAESAVGREIREWEARIEVKIDAFKSEIVNWMFAHTLLILGGLLAIRKLGY